MEPSCVVTMGTHGIWFTHPILEYEVGMLRCHVMASTMTTRNAGRRTAATRGGRTGEQAGRGSGRTGEETGRESGQTGEYK
ncbi:hypothetical protein Tco_1405554 [Tanacetum coccineum]